MPVFDPRADTYTFKIRPGLKWSDGTPIDASTYAYSLNRSLDPCTFSPLAYSLFAIQDAQAFATETCAPGGRSVDGKIKTLVGDSLLVPDSQTLVIELAAPAPYFLAALTTPVAFAQPEQLIDRYSRQNWFLHLADNGGFGGNLFRVKSWDHRTGQLDLTACLSTCGATLPVAGWGRHTSAPHLRELDFSFLRYADSEETAYKAGELDVALFPSTSFRDAVSGSGSSFVEVKTLAIDYLQPNWAKAPFDDLRARQAFALALDKDALATQMDLMPTNHIVPYGLPGYDPNLLGPDETTNTGGNVPLARQLLQSYADDECDGQFSRCPSFSLQSEERCVDPMTFAYEQAAVRMWRQAFPGYPVKVLSTLCGISGPLTQLYPANAPPMFIAGWIADYPDPQDWLSLQFGPEAVNNLGSVVAPVADTLMAEADQEQDPGQRLALYNEAEQLLVQDVAWIPVGQELAYYAVRPSVVGFASTTLGVPSLDQMYSLELVKR